ncbi:hypothetical protein BHE74_00051732 [Ensete ventricosum]|nr:hypothetical protein BHE74_00051732 [Ensete ventricosum]
MNQCSSSSTSPHLVACVLLPPLTKTSFLSLPMQESLQGDYTRGNHPNLLLLRVRVSLPHMLHGDSNPIRTRWRCTSRSHITCSPSSLAFTSQMHILRSLDWIHMSQGLIGFDAGPH